MKRGKGRERRDEEKGKEREGKGKGGEGKGGQGYQGKFTGLGGEKKGVKKRGREGKIFFIEPRLIGPRCDVKCASISTM